MCCSIFCIFLTFVLPPEWWCKCKTFEIKDYTKAFFYLQQIVGSTRCSRTTVSQPLSILLSSHARLKEYSVIPNSSIIQQITIPFLTYSKMYPMWGLKMIKQHKILFWNQSTYCMGFLGFVFVQLDYNLDPCGAQRRGRLCFQCNPILTFTASNNNIYVMEICITGNQSGISPFSSPVGG